MITGKLLGDGCITRQEGRKPRFQFIHSINDKDWCYYCYEELRKGLPLALPHYRKFRDDRTIKGYTESYQVQSRTDPTITWLESLWYSKRKKVIPFSFLEHFLNEEALAWWYQDDGHLSKVGPIPKKVILSTDNFTPIENRRLIGLLSRKFCLHFRLDSQNRLILYDQLQIYYFLRLIEPFIHPSMKRKVITPNTSSPSFAKKRTTIYLPESFHLKKPTVEIHKKFPMLPKLTNIVIDRNSYISFYKDVIANFSLKEKNKGYQIVIDGQYYYHLQSIKSQTGLSFSQIITICFSNNY